MTDYPDVPYVRYARLVDQIEALEAEIKALRMFCSDYQERLEHYEAALREIAGLYEGLDILHAITLARAALEGKK